MRLQYIYSSIGGSSSMKLAIDYELLQLEEITVNK